VVTVSPTEQFVKTGQTGTSPVSTSGTYSATYQKQWKIPASYSTSDYSTPSANVVLSGTQAGDNTFTLTLTTSVQNVWLDAGTSWSVNNPIPDSPTTERWIAASGTSGTVGSSTLISPLYYHQYEITFGYSDQDSSAITEGGKIGSYTQFGSSNDINAGASYGSTSPASAWVDAGTGKVSYQTYPTSATTERWALSTSPDNKDVSSSTTLSETEYYHQFYVTFQYSVSDSSTPTAPTVYYTQFGGSATTTAALDTSVSDWVDAGTAVQYDNPLSDSSGTERWMISGGATPKATVDDSVDASETLNPTYYHQFSVSFDYSTNDASTINSQNNLVAYTQFGGTLHLSTNSLGALSLSSDWADAGSSVLYTSPVSISASERYMIASGDIGTHTVISSVASDDRTADPEYYHQFKMTLSYSVVGDGSGYSAPTFTAKQFGLSVDETLSTTATDYWFDADSWSVTNPLEELVPISSEQWILSPSQSASGTVSATTIEFTYYHQFYVTASYSTSDGSTPSEDVVLSGTQSGDNTFTLTLTTSIQHVWLDAGSGWSVNNPIPVVVVSERWYAASGTSGTVSDTTVVAPLYYHQFKMTFQYSIANTPAGSPSSGPTVTFNQFGSSKSSDVATLAPDTSSYDWVDASSSTSAITYANPLGVSTSTERWQASSTPSYAATSSTTLDPTYHHQWLLTLSYSVVGDGSGYSAPAFTAKQFGVSSPQTLSTTPTDYWFDADSWSVTDPLGESPPIANEQWKLSPLQSSTGTVSAATINFEYYHQYLMTLSYSVSDPSTPSSTPKFTADQFGSPIDQDLTTTPTDYWFDADSWSVSNPIPSHPTTERWMLSPSQDASGTVSATTIVFAYYHQYYLTVTASPSEILVATFKASYKTYGVTHTDEPETISGTTPWAQWVDANTVTLSDPQAVGYTFDHWLVDGSNSGSATSLPVTMDSAKTVQIVFKFNLAVETGFKPGDSPSFASDPYLSDVMCVLVKATGGYKLVGTSPGTFDYAIAIKNTGGTTFTSITITVTWKPTEFALQSSNPIRVLDSNGADISSQFTKDVSGSTITISSITYELPAYGSLYVTIHLDYKPKGTVVGTSSVYNKAYTFETEVEGTSGPNTGTTDAYGSVVFLSKKTTIIYGFVKTSSGKPIEGAKIELYKGLTSYTVYTDADGFFCFINGIEDDLHNLVALSGGTTYTVICTPPPSGPALPSKSVTAQANSAVSVNFQV